MTITYHAGRRLQGLDADRTATQLPAGLVGGWVELGRTTLNSTTSTVTVSSLPDKRYYMVLLNGIASGNINGYTKFNGDTGSNYANRWSHNGGAEGYNSNDSYGVPLFNGNFGGNNFGVGYIANKSDKEKLFLGHAVAGNASGASNAPNRIEAVGKWANTSNAINSIASTNYGSGYPNYDSGTEMVVLGYDPADTHTTNFWEELDSVTQSSDATTFVSNTFTNKKYLWIQAWLDIDSTYQVGMRFNNVSTASYATRYSDNNNGDGTLINQTSVTVSSDQNTPRFVNMFIVNDGTNEPLVIGHLVDTETSGAGTAPRRREFVSKCSTTTAITSIQFIKAAGAGDHILQNSKLRIWGAD
jgi:hypothetical protein